MPAIFNFPGKMIIPIVSAPGALPEWAIIELQGNLETYQKVIDTSTEKFIGDLHYEKGKDNSAILIIGMHILYGKEVNLPKSLGVLIKKKRNINNEDKECEESNTEWTVQAVVKKKLVFKTRPRPIVTDLPKST